MRRFLYLWLFGLLVSWSSQSKNIIIAGQQSNEDTAHAYFVELLNLALAKTRDNSPYQNVIILDSGQTTQGRAIKLLQENIINVYWTGSNKTRESIMLPIKVPLFKGLLGYRISIIKQQDLLDFTNISEARLKQKIACQGEHWPDSDILEANGYHVLRVARFDLMFKMLVQGRCDYFPRAIYEGYGELEKAKLKYPNLIIYDETILQYPFPMYFFTSLDNIELAMQIETGLLKALEDGSLQRLMENHSTTLGIFPLSQWRDRQYFHLVNDSLPNVSQFIDTPLWLTLYPQ